MTSFGATKIISEGGYMPTFKVQGQIYHKIGSLLAVPQQDAKFLQIYFTGNDALEVGKRCAISSGFRREIISSLQAMFHEQNSLIRLFKTALDQMPSDDYSVVIRADKAPAGEHERRFNAPVTGDVAIVIVGTEFDRRDIIIHRRNANVQRVSETHRSYDALQYPVLFPHGEEGYHFNIRQVDPSTSEATTKKVSCMDYYANRIMIRGNESNHILKCRELFQQFIVDMYAKVECERLLFIRLNQKKLRVEEYVHLRDAVANDGNIADIGQMVILPITYTGSPRHMHEYGQDAMTVISAELPNQAEDPILFEIIKKNMIHGPCGTFNPNSPCMQNGKCTKRYPRATNGGYTTTIKMRSVDIDIDNRWIVPYSPLLSKMFNAHINVEYCNSGATSAVTKQYGGYLHSIFTNDIQRFKISLFIWKMVSGFTSPKKMRKIEQPQNTTLTAFFELGTSENFAKTLLYQDVPKYYTWKTSTKKFNRRKRGAIVPEHPGIYSSDALGRVYTVHPNNAECYYLRLLLHTIKGPTSFLALKTIDGVEFQTYREACFKLGLLENDQNWNTTLTEASLTCHPKQIRNLFAIILTTCAPSNPRQLWEMHRESLSEDILGQARASDPSQEYSDDIFNEALILMEDLCMSINNKALCQLGMPAPTRDRNAVQDRDLMREQQFDANQLERFVQTQNEFLVADQKKAYDKIMQRVTEGDGGIIFLDAPGGTGKTFLINLILASVRMRNGIAVAVASSGIASTLLDGGRTAHSALKLPLNLHQTETPTCNISKNSGMAIVLKTCKFIIWDECTMAHKKSLEALDRTLRDFRGKEQPMGGTLILLAGDFRQTLPVIPRSSPADELNACLKASHLWNYVEKITLTTNMCPKIPRSPDRTHSPAFQAEQQSTGNAAATQLHSELNDNVVDPSAVGSGMGSEACSQSNQVIRMPSTLEEMRKTSLTFYKIAKFPGVIGSIDCTHVRIQSPGTDQAKNYRNRKGWFSIKVQTVVDAGARITNTVARWPGSTHDDGGYRNNEYMVTPHLNPQIAEK
ncbi:uncharacterized protein LOC118749766 [Rhagoletis pomonella]|uniref:uncharacterized protein LOC118749766 n=1 Tax=Rhagoletis pomonella TaxID=28610 RepID=UPI00177EDC5C|nr:uncharacterized protein LOC118749766 [Rhagoletis pomonella]